MKQHTVGIIMNGVTGRMGTNQHLLRSIAEIIRQGGVKCGSSETIMPDPILVGRNETKLKNLCNISGISKMSTDLDEVLKDRNYQLYFDAQTTGRRVDAVKKAIRAGKHIYCEKPVAISTEAALELYELCRDAGLKNGVVQDKLWLPGILKLKRLIETGFFGRILSVRGEFGYWVFEGETIPAQRPSWNYRSEDDGGIILDMLCHWRYVLDNVFGKVKAVSCLGATHIPERFDEEGKAYKCTADDAAYATFELENGIIAHFNSSWAVRVRRDDLLTLQVDGTRGSAVAGLRECYIQHYGNTPKPVWNPDIPQPIDFFEGWSRVPEQENYDNAFKAQWELFLKHVVKDEPFPWDLHEGAKGVQLAEKGMESWKKRCWTEIPELKK
ncbi:MAG TPA: Gfo/Idh/MocA family oxidoreductase [Bacteroidales bacterium]|jgi:predicted dehydrogenase|nr:Gfo/Idh/MocA family oxidoreductase [Bacteroidales bacterium]HOS70828.1 Gfo/Idh/MocA family oxidoreductase [Bacteroidales bacterium]HQH24445.1 Gfo/Idh/MocA family oxidoreductase [Bacteroidales bacterium]HQJ81422.1 Gfo/Idh/MocA family oxidoreductase [Bacteroidales bacterium]